MKQYLSTGQSARLLGATEPQLADLVRRNKIDPTPEVFAGRRLWNAEHLRQPAVQLGVWTEPLSREIARTVVSDAGAVPHAS